MERKIVKFSYPCEGHVMIERQRVAMQPYLKKMQVEIPPAHYTYWPPGIIDVWFRMETKEYYDEESEILYEGYPAAWIIKIHGAPELVVPIDREEEGEVMYPVERNSALYFRLLPPTYVPLSEIRIEGNHITSIDRDIIQHWRSVDRDLNDWFWCENYEEPYCLPQLYGEEAYETPFEDPWD